jgi:methyl coenzyme M reductase gamma subunit
VIAFPSRRSRPVVVDLRALDSGTCSTRQTVNGR